MFEVTAGGISKDDSIIWNIGSNTGTSGNTGQFVPPQVELTMKNIRH